MREGQGGRILFGLTAAAMVCLFLAPLVMVVGGGFFESGRFTLRFISGVFANPVYAECLRNSVWIAMGTLFLASLIAVPLAWLGQRFDFSGKKWATSLLLVPMILPPFVGAIGFQQLLGPYGVLNSAAGWGPVDWLGSGRYAGVVLLQALSLYPILYLNLSAALANVDPAMEEAAANLGCPPLRRFFHITLPLIMPGFFAGGVIIFIWSFTELGTPLIMNYTRCAPVQIFGALKEIGANPFPYALVFVMLMASVALYAVARGLFGRQAHAMQSKAATVAAPLPLRGWRAVAVLAPFVAVVALAMAPHIAVILTSLSEPGAWYRTVLPDALTSAHYREALGHGMTLGGIRNSLMYSGVALGVNVVLGLAVAWVTVRTELRGRGWLDAAAMLPLAVPGLVMAFGYLALSNWLSHRAWITNSDFWTGLFDVRTNPAFFLIIAYAVRRLPYMVRSAAAGLQQTSPVFEEAAASLGATPGTVLRRITLPLIMANIVAGGLLVFAFSMLEVSDSLMLAQRQDFYPITKTIYELFQLVGEGPYLAAALGVWAMAFLAVTIAAAGRLLGARLGTLFRV